MRRNRIIAGVAVALLVVTLAWLFVWNDSLRENLAAKKAELAPVEYFHSPEIDLLRSKIEALKARRFQVMFGFFWGMLGLLAAAGYFYLRLHEPAEADSDSIHLDDESEPADRPSLEEPERETEHAAEEPEFEPLIAGYAWAAPETGQRPMPEDYTAIGDRIKYPRPSIVVTARHVNMMRRISAYLLLGATIAAAILEQWWFVTIFPLVALTFAHAFTSTWRKWHLSWVAIVWLFWWGLILTIHLKAT